VRSGGALIPSDVVTSCGAQVLNAVTARLVGYGTDGSVQPNLAGAIDTTMRRPSGSP